MILKFLTSSSVLHLNSIGLSACSRLHFLTHRSCNAVWPLGSFDHVQSFSFQSLSLFVLPQLKWRQRPQTVSSLPYRRNRWWELEAWWGPTKGRLPLPTQLLMSCSRLQATQHSRRTVTQTNRYAGHEIVKQKWQTNKKKRRTLESSNRSRKHASLWEKWKEGMKKVRSDRFWWKGRKCN